MSITESMQAVADKIAAEGVAATCDPRGATPPCVLVEYPNLRFDVGCGATGEWTLIAIAPGVANLDAVAALEPLLAACQAAVSVERADKVAYPLSPDNPPHPAYRVAFAQGVEL